jgi:hypothetical protein
MNNDTRAMASGENLQAIVDEQTAYAKGKSKFINFSARTCQPNDKHTDAEMFVWHKVNYTEIQPGGCVLSKGLDLLAMCPMDAMDSANEYLTNSD